MKIGGGEVGAVQATTLPSERRGATSGAAQSNRALLMFAMETFELIIGRADNADFFEWTIAAGAERMENGVEDDIITCLRAAVSCFRSDAPIKFTICYEGTEVGDYSRACLLVNAAGVADSIIERVQGGL